MEVILLMIRPVVCLRSLSFLGSSFVLAPLVTKVGGSMATMRGSRKFCQRYPNLTAFFFLFCFKLMRGERIQISL